MNLILTLRTDKPEAEIGLYNAQQILISKKWTAHKELGVTIHNVIKEKLQLINKDWDNIKAIVFFEGPGSFTGLRIGASVVNALAYSNNIPVVAASGEDWIREGVKAIKTGKSGPVLPVYGAEVFTTNPKK